MGNITSELYSNCCELFRRKPIKVLMFGPFNSGKTSILRKFKPDDRFEICPTVGWNIDRFHYKNRYFEVTDYTGNEKYRVPRFHLRKTKVLIFVVNSGNRNVMYNARDDLRWVLQQREVKNAIVLVYANKQDFSDAMPLEEISKRLELDRINRHQIKIQSCNAVEGHGVFEGLDWIRAALR